MTSVKWLGGRVVMQRPAKPCTAVRFRPQPPLPDGVVVDASLQSFIYVSLVVRYKSPFNARMALW
jgi:hypothetical protein